MKLSLCTYFYCSAVLFQTAITCRLRRSDTQAQQDFGRTCVQRAFLAVSPQLSLHWFLSLLFSFFFFFMHDTDCHLLPPTPPSVSRSLPSSQSLTPFCTSPTLRYLNKCLSITMVQCVEYRLAIVS